ncbi:hypothetical protein H112_03215 [Trichophyton rubrum D6]|uniref:Spc7 kinetochore protein domain-containing protein n=3 Tax=Trichophyton TaxID=5550 RepID=A0A178EVX6_TRIRU|nr:hypothetical protein H100_03219 [Trichophyton rubrum MR850]EZF43323.1 hypothetical protein H102_03213 [Trichophyton rubrum CBS 100081]EZF53965.1 hypothetical protein H103_03227 [Trichophyton rubrum CBS 288.86]EZF64548.1 hypothetical protein H104_03209 [Trichophyton rubrum CBS 289.86]EZF75194.1 hypothetical protein H105_03231 [Trichophyton soudanense CBS 452.61]EZF85892.1 hypothetical protein H110_03220 [Trichophyton rubrum MR1448]EZF96673.1 hypothetical protein H113_03228 [Trichophyton rub
MSSYTRDPSNVARVRARRSLAQIPHRGSGIDIDKENVTTDFSAAQKQSNMPSRASGNDKRSRSKSLGPGGLDLLKNGGNDRRKSTAAVQLKSILKPTIPVSPISHIPSFAETRRKTPHRNGFENNYKSSGNDDLIDLSTPAAPVVGTDNLINPFDNFNPIPPSRAKDMAAQRDREEKERIEREREKKKAILEQRAARRKSMANRRVSFAPEATLHTWNVVELMEDSTASTGVNTTRRNSSLMVGHRNQGSDDSEPPSSPGKYEFVDVNPPQSAAHLEELADEAFSSSPFSGGSAAENDTGFPQGNMEMGSDSLSSGPEDESTSMSMENVTEQPLSSESNDSSPSSSSLDRSLKKAALAAGTRGIEFDENGDLSMEFTSHEIVGAFQPWVKKGSSAKFDAEDLTSRFDQENVGSTKMTASNSMRAAQVNEDDGDMSMDITKPVGGILRRKSNITSGSSEESRPYLNYQNYGYQQASRRTSAVTNLGDQTMEFTNVIGGIKSASPKRPDTESNIDTDEEMTMEFTNVLGGVLNKQNFDRKTDYESQEDSKYGDEGDIAYPDLGEDAMEMTGAVGGILPPIEERTEPSDDGTMGMDMTNAVGKILAPFQASNPKDKNRIFDEHEEPPPSSPFQENIPASPARAPLPPHADLVTSEGGSPLRAIPRLNSTSRQPSSSPRRSVPPQSSPGKGLSTLSKQQSPHTVRQLTPATPEGSPIKPKSRSVSPQKRHISQTNQPPVKAIPALFQRNSLTGQSTPTFVLKALNHASHDRSEARGSPRIAEILDRRRSIGEDAQEFVLKPTPNRGVKFDDTLKTGQEYEKVNEEDNFPRTSQESGKEATLNLSELISSLTPKKNKLKGRKSLHVGAARGLLGKRPPELDMDDADEDLTPQKRLRGREASPVKNIKLPAPASKANTAGRPSQLTLHYDRSVSPSIDKNIFSGKHRASPKDLVVHTPTGQASLQEAKEGNNILPGGISTPVEPIKLSDFLEMTNIHFMELTTTKRRHTIAPGSPEKCGTESLQGAKEFGLEDRVAAGFCTLPMLELYQHSCRELKSYISEGRRIIRSIEAETYSENPPLFQEYITATPDIRLLMDNQFRNVKTHARLLSKEMWYEWRMKLLEGLKQGLDRHVDEMKQDDEILSKKENILANVVPGLIERHGKLEIDSQNLQKVIDEIENCDQEELRDAREKLLAVETELSGYKDKYTQARGRLEAKSVSLEKAQARREELLQEIREAESIKEECRGWDEKEVRVLQDSVNSLEKQTGWAIISAKPSMDAVKGITLSMRYRGELQLDCNPSHIHTLSQNLTKDERQASQHDTLPLTLTYAPRGNGLQSAAVNPSPGASLILNAIRMQVSYALLSPVSLKQLLSGIARCWETAKSLQEEIRMLGYCGIVNIKSIGAKRSEPTLLKIRCTLLGNIKDKISPEEVNKPKKKQGERARVDIDFTAKPKALEKYADGPNIGVGIDFDATASTVYGFETSNDSETRDLRMNDLLTKLMEKPNQTFGSGLLRATVKAVEKRVFHL